MTEPTTTAACGCGHRLAEHYANGCGWCICTVPGPATEDAQPAPSAASEASPIHHWNYRMFTRRAPIADTGDYDEEHFIGEAYYDAADNLVAWSADPMPAGGLTPEALIADLNRMIEAAGKEPLAVEDLRRVLDAPN